MTDRPLRDENVVEGDGPLPPEHPAGSDAPVSAGEVLSGEGIGTGKAGPGPATSPTEPPREVTPGEEA